MRRIAKTSEQARHEIATGAVGLFVALSFALAADGVKDAWKEPALHNAAIVDSAVFCLAGLSFFLGTQAWLWSDAIQTARTPVWLYNFFFTLVTLIIITMMGAFVGTEHIFYPWVMALYITQSVWILAGRIPQFRVNVDRHQPEWMLMTWWAGFAAAGMLVFAAAAVFPIPRYAALIGIGILRIGNLTFDLFVAVPRIWGQTEPDHIESGRVNAGLFRQTEAPRSDP